MPISHAYTGNIIIPHDLILYHIFVYLSIFFVKNDRSLKFKIYDEYGIYQNGDDYIRPLGKGGRLFRSDKSRAKFEEEYRFLMSKFKPK